MEDIVSKIINALGLDSEEIANAENDRVEASKETSGEPQKIVDATDERTAAAYEIATTPRKATNQPYDTFPTPEFGDAVWLFNSHNQLANGVEELKPTYNNQWEALEAILDLTNSLCREPGVINLNAEDLRSCIGQGRKLLMAKTKGQLAPRKASNHRTEQLTSLGKECCKTLGAYATQGKNGLIQLSGGRNLSLLGIDEALEAITEELPENCDIVFGASLDMENSEDFMKIELLLEVEQGIATLPPFSVLAALSHKNKSYRRKW